MEGQTPVLELQEVPMVRVYTTIGDLICALVDIAEETRIEDKDIPYWTKEVLCRMGIRYK